MAEQGPPDQVVSEVCRDLMETDPGPAAEEETAPAARATAAAPAVVPVFEDPWHLASGPPIGRTAAARPLLLMLADAGPATDPLRHTVLSPCRAWFQEFAATTRRASGASSTRRAQLVKVAVMRAVRRLILPCSTNRSAAAPLR